jgi:demethylmenaquinone methyltransferase/2-methoxy-6-polyprenyl-1,4-benzoquinol methylase
MTKTKAKKIIGLDISAGMLEVGKKKLKALQFTKVKMVLAIRKTCLLRQFF